MPVSAHRKRPDRAEWRPASPEARTLGGSLRAERLTVLLGHDSSSLTSLLTAGVLPLLGRRAADATARATDDVMRSVVPFPERRRSPEETATEILVLFDAARERSVDLLKSRFEASVRAAGFPPYGNAIRCLADHIDALSATHQARFLFIIDGFQALLPAGGTSDSAQLAMLEELTEILNRPSPANLLVAATESSWAFAGPFIARLRQVNAAVVTVGAVASTADPRLPNLKLHIPPSPPTLVDALAYTDSSIAEAPAAVADPAWTRDTEVDSRPHHVSIDNFFGPPSRRAPSRAAKRKARWAVAFGAVLMLAAALALWPKEPRDAAPSIAAGASDLHREAVKVQPKARAADVPVPVPVPVLVPVPALAHAPASIPSRPPLPEMARQIDGEGHLSRRMATELAQALGTQEELDVQPRTAQNVMARLSGGDSAPPRLAIASYDDLKSIAGSNQAMRLKVVAPLGLEAIQVMVRTDSALHYLHQLEGKHIDVGPAGASRAVTAGFLYRKMFGTPLPARDAITTEAPAAVQALLHDHEHGPDAVLMLGAQAQSVLASLTEAERQALRALALSRDQDASRRARQDYLPATLVEALGNRLPALASMNFLVATGANNADETERLDRLAKSLCAQLPRLQREGDPAWRDVQAGLQVPIPLPHVDTQVIDSAWAGCTPAGSSSSVTLK